MNCAWIKKAVFFGLLLMSLSAVSAQAQTASPNVPSETSLIYAKLIANACPDQWESPACLSAVSTSNLALAANYGGALQEAKLDAAAEKIKQHCAASTAAREQEFPAYAMKSAFDECATTMLDVSDETGIPPDQSHYQLLWLAAVCLANKPECAPISEDIKKYRK
jgi:hypothetical protein